MDGARRSLNICLLTKTTLAHGIGGVETHVESLCRGVPAAGHALTVIASRHPRGVRSEARGGAQVHYLSRGRVARYGEDFWDALDEAFLRLHGKARFDIVWAEDFAGYHYGWKLKGEAGIPLLTIVQGAPFSLRIESEWSRVSTFREFASFALKFLPESYVRYRKWYRRTLAGSDHVSAVSRESAAALAAEHGIPAGKIGTIFDAVDTERFRPSREERARFREKHGIPGDAPAALMAAVVHKQKGMHIGLEAFRSVKDRVPNARLIVAGDGPHLAELKLRALKLGLASAVVFCGAVRNEEMPSLYNACDVFLNPTLRWEGLTITTVEALACGKPAVVSRIGGTGSTIVDGVSGFFVRPGDAPALAAKCLALFEDEGLRARMSAAARDRAAAVFGQETMVADYLAVSRRLVSLSSKTARSRDAWRRVLAGGEPAPSLSSRSAGTPEREDFAREFGRSASTFLRYDYAAEALKRSLRPGARVLEIGSGYGLGTCLLSALGWDASGLDASEEAEAEARRRYPWLDFTAEPSESFARPASFDAIVALEVVEHLKDWQTAVDNWKASLREGGILVLSTPNRPYNSGNPLAAPNRFHLKEFDLDELAELFPGARFSGISFMFFKSRFHNPALRAAFFALAAMLSPFEFRRSTIGGAGAYSRRDLLYGKFGRPFPRWSGGLFLVWRKNAKIPDEGAAAA